MWLLPRTDNEKDFPCFQHFSVTNIVTHIWLDRNENMWKIVQRQHSHGPHELLASLPYDGGFPAPANMWHLEPVLGNGGALSVHIWSSLEYKAKCQEATTEPKFTQLSERILDLKASMQHDVDKIKEKVSTWEADRDLMHDSVKNVTEMVATLKKRQDSFDDEVKALRDQTKRYYSEASHPPRKKGKGCFCDGRSRALSKGDVLEQGATVKFLHNGKLEDRVISSSSSRGGYWLETSKRGSYTWASKKQLFIRDQCRDCCRAMGTS